MSNGSYSFATEPGRHFLRVTLAGSWDAALTALFVADLERTIRGMVGAGAVYGQFVTLVDMRDKNILPQDAAAEFAKIVRPESPSRKIAMLVSGTLHKLQAKRLSGERHRIFATEQEAMAWLDA